MPDGVVVRPLRVTVVVELDDGSKRKFTIIDPEAVRVATPLSNAEFGSVPKWWPLEYLHPDKFYLTVPYGEKTVIQYDAYDPNSKRSRNEERQD